MDLERNIRKVGHFDERDRESESERMKAESKRK